MRATLGFLDANGNFLPVKPSRPLPTTGGGGGGGGGITEVNGDTGPVVTLDANDVGAAPKPPSAPGQQNRVQLFAADGTVSTYGNAVTTASQGAIPLRTTNGHIILPTTAPTSDSWAASKKYVDDAIAAALANVIRGDGTITNLVAKTQAEYDAVTPKVATTQYTIREP